jgi:hypothetical protein
LPRAEREAKIVELLDRAEELSRRERVLSAMLFEHGGEEDRQQSFEPELILGLVGA